jgi:hypothetical protein
MLKIFIVKNQLFNHWYIDYKKIVWLNYEVSLTNWDLHDIILCPVLLITYGIIDNTVNLAIVIILLMLPVYTGIWDQSYHIMLLLLL